MELTVAGLVFAAAAVHPLRELVLKGNSHPETGYFGVILTWLVVSATHGLATGADFTAAAAVWPQLAVSACGLVLYYLGILTAMKTGDMSIYYPIIRAAPVVIVVIGWAFLGHSYGPALLAGVALVTIGAFFLQFRPGADPFGATTPLIAALLALFGMGIQSLADASAMKVVHAPVLLFWEYLFVAPVCLAYFALRKRPGRSLGEHLFRGWLVTPGRYLLAAGSSYLSYYLILTAYKLGGNVAAINSLRQISIPLSVVMGGMVLKEAQLGRRFKWSLVLVAGILIIIVTK